MHGNSDRSRNDWPLGPARRSALIITGLGLLGLLAAFANGLQLPAQLAISVVVLAMAGYALLRLLRPRVAGLKIDGQHIHVREESGARFSGDLIGAPFVSPFYVGLRWRGGARRLPRSLGIFREQMKARDFRRLCATLRQRGEW